MTLRLFLCSLCNLWQKIISRKGATTQKKIPSLRKNQYGFYAWRCFEAICFINSNTPQIQKADGFVPRHDGTLINLFCVLLRDLWQKKIPQKK
jgi:hypothetical protein